MQEWDATLERSRNIAADCCCYTGASNPLKKIMNFIK